MNSLSFDVVGTPAPQGSKRMVPTAQGDRLIETNHGHKRVWRGTVAQAARAAHGDAAPLDGPLRVEITFRFSMPRSRPARVRTAGVAWKTSAPDVDKLVRSTLDALTEAGAIADDARIAELVARKIEIVGWTGATIVVTALDVIGGEA